jgi:hypothetical protein
MKSKEDQPFFAAVGMCDISALLLAECSRVRNKGRHTFGNVVSDGIYKVHINGSSSDVFHSNKAYSSNPLTRLSIFSLSVTGRGLFYIIKQWVGTPELIGATAGKVLVTSYFYFPF